MSITLPGESGLKYGSSITVRILKTRNEVPAKTMEWTRRSGRTLQDLAMADHAILIDVVENGSYLVDFVKSRNPTAVIEWFWAQLGEPGPDGTWESISGTEYHPSMIVRDKDAIVLIKMVWE